MRRYKDKIASGLGSVLEWYDFALYGFFAQLIAQLYFPSASQSTAMLKTFSVFAIGFIARPIGALLFGHIGDKYGRTASLKLTPILITIPTLLFAILPTYQQIGVLAPIILILLRIWQGICVGGEFANNIVYLCETSAQNRTFFYGSIGSCTGSLGIFLASIVATLWYKIFPHENLITWGWRLAFILASAIGIITFLMRRNMSETPIFNEINRKQPVMANSSWGFCKSNLQNYLVAFGLTFLPATAFYYVFMFLPNFLNEILNIDTSKISSENSLSLFMRLLIIPVIGLAADKFGGIKIARTASILFLLFSYPLLFGITNYLNITHLFIYGFAFLTTLNAATTPGLLMKLLKPETRCTVLSFSFNFCFGVFGGLVPIICFLLISQFKNTMASIYYLMFAAFVTFIATFFFNKAQYEQK
ncbi:MAG: MFS transporter [Tatlockia sp.]|nr:MFS transporter [Tatlockia sp.]